MEIFSQTIKDETREPCLPTATKTIPFMIEGENWTLTHTFPDLRSSGLIRYRYDSMRARDYLNGWIAHLFLNATVDKHIQPHTVWHAQDDTYKLSPVPDASMQLKALVSLYRQGLTTPLHFYPASSWEYIRNEHDLKTAKKLWQGRNEMLSGEKRDVHYRQALRGINNPLDADFEHCAQVVFEPMLAHLSSPGLE
jgi:exodeoxyribonuclease V gamma subunit